MAARSRLRKRRYQRRRTKSPVPAILFTTLGGISIIALLVFFSGEGEVEAGPTPLRARAETGMSNPRVAGVRAWAEAIAAADTKTLDKHSDYSELGRRLQEGLQDPTTDRLGIHSLLLKGEDSQWFRQFEVTAAEIEGLSQEMATADRGTVMLHLSPRPEHEDEFIGSMDISVDFAMVSGIARVQGWSNRRMPGRIRQEAKPKFHPEIGPAKALEIKLQEMVTEVPIADSRPLDHQQTTPPELRQTIDSDIRSLLDVEGPARSFSTAWRRLVKIGKPAIPRLLNALHETPMDSQENLIRLRRVLVVLQKMTGLYFSFDHAALGAVPFDGSTQKTRELAVKSWYGWWTTSHKEAIDATLKAAREATEADLDPGKQSPELRPKKR